MGKPIQVVADQVSLIAGPRTWIEGDAIQQLITTAKLPGMRRVVGMPDLHPGRGYPVGAAFFSQERFYPALIGNDIGCGMALWQTDLKLAKRSLDKLERQLGNIDGPLDASWQADIAECGLEATGFEASLGTIGGGNHFAELQQIDGPLGANGQEDIAKPRLASADFAAALGTIGGGNHFAELQQIDGPLGANGQEDIAKPRLASADFAAALGTIGGGNHFAELQQVDAILAPEVFATTGLDTKRLVLLVHSGSRGLGQAILQQQVQSYGHAGLVAGSAAAQAYLRQHQQACQFARINRQYIARRMLERWSVDGQCYWDITHNSVTPYRLEGIDGWLHRKGASPADQGLMVIPGSRGDYSYLVLPHPDPCSLFSLAHGAGRKWRRSDCQAQMLARTTVAQLTRTALGSRVICHDRQLLLEEAPEAYKRIDEVVATLVAAGLLTLVARLKPVLTYKNAGGCCA